MSTGERYIIRSYRKCKPFEITFDRLPNHVEQFLSRIIPLRCKMPLNKMPNQQTIDGWLYLCVHSYMQPRTYFFGLRAINLTFQWYAFIHIRQQSWAILCTRDGLQRFVETPKCYSMYTCELVWNQDKPHWYNLFTFSRIRNVKE